MISGRCRSTLNHLLTEHGDEHIRRLLIDSYKKFKIFYESLNRISKNYTNYKAELISVNEISDIKMRSNIKIKLDD